MCACCCYNSLLLIFISFSITTRMMITEGLPLSRLERGDYQDIIAGADFLSILMESPSVRQAYKELTTQLPPNEANKFKQITRVVRQSTLESKPFTETPKFYQSTKGSTEENINSSSIVSVKVSSSVGDSYIDKGSKEEELVNPSEPTVDMDKSLNDQVAYSSEDHTSIVARANHNPFRVDEMEPITSNNNPYGYLNAYPNVHSGSKLTNTVSPLHHSVIYHDSASSSEPVRGRSVSYSAVIQTLPNQHQQFESPYSYGLQNRRQERHYDSKDSFKRNQFEQDKQKNLTNGKMEEPYYQSTSDASKSISYFTNPYASSSFPTIDTSSKESEWKSTRAFESSTNSKMEFTEKNWEVAEKQYEEPESTYVSQPVNNQQYVPVVYGKAEENYEIDESVSVITNGRTHGIKSTVSSENSTPPINKSETNHKPNDNQKVGYVVEGRNYRKYRVEERTSDGFIVGEYGVVSHNDGSLRGVRYTADGTINPRVIYDALMKFLSL